MASLSLRVPVVPSGTANPRGRTGRLCRSSPTACYINKPGENKNSFCWGGIGEVVQRDANFLRAGFSKAFQWARLPELSKSVEDLIWLRNVQDLASLPLKFPSWPHPFYPDLSGTDLFLADLKALEVYAGYFHHLSKMWTRPLPEEYNAELVTEYFILRPHVVAIRLVEVFTALVSAMVKFRFSRFSFSKDEDDHEITSNYYFGMVLKETMLDLGPTFIKIGQSLSTRPDMIGHDMAKALSDLHDQVPPFPRTEAMKIIEEELSSPAETCFSYFSKDPVAAASFGQVYKASTLDGFDVAVKVQRPNMRHVVFRDIYILRIGLALLQKIAKRTNDLRHYADELGKGLIGELDYNMEASNALEFMEVHSRFTFMNVPKVFLHLTNKRVLTMEWMAGDSPKELISLGSPQSNAKLLDLVSKGVEASLVQLLDTGLMHADPHPGNLRYTKSGKIGFLDFGLVCRMEEKHQFAMLAATIHIVNSDWASLVNDLREMDVIKPGTNIWRFTMDLENALGAMEFNNGIPDIKFSRVLGKIWSVALKYHCRLPPYYILVLRSLASLEGLAVATDSNFKTFEAAYPYVVQKLLFENSAATRRVLHSVVLNRKREFQWQKLAMFLKGGATRWGLQSVISSNTRIPLAQPTTGVDPEQYIASFALRLLTSRNGHAFRRLLFTADGASLIRALVSDEAASYRQQLCRGIAEILFQQMTVALQKALNLMMLFESSSGSTAGHEPNDCGSFLRDRRLRIIFFKSVTCARKDPILFMRFCWASVVMIFMASAIACQRIMLSLSRSCFGRLPLVATPPV